MLFDAGDLFSVVSNVEIRNRIRVAVAAYAYEFENDSIMTDSEYDELSLKIRPWIGTGNKLLDDFFSSEFTASSGQWVHGHPELGGIKWLYVHYYKKEH